MPDRVKPHSLFKKVRKIVTSDQEGLNERGKKIHYPLALKRKIPLHIMSNFVKFHILMLSTLTDFMYTETIKY